RRSHPGISTLFLEHHAGISGVSAGSTSAHGSASHGNASPKKTNKGAPVRLPSELKEAEAALRLGWHQPARKFLLEVACEIHTKFCARVQTQRVSIGASEH